MTYLTDEKYAELNDALANIKPRLGFEAKDELPFILGSFGIWPEHSRPADED